MVKSELSFLLLFSNDGNCTEESLHLVESGVFTKRGSHSSFSKLSDDLEEAAYFANGDEDHFYIFYDSLDGKKDIAETALSNKVDKIFAKKVANKHFYFRSLNNEVTNLRQACLIELENFLPKYILDNLRKADGKGKTIMFCGNTNAGKTTLIDSILNMPILPTKFLRNTSHEFRIHVRDSTKEIADSNNEILKLTFHDGYHSHDSKHPMVFKLDNGVFSWDDKSDDRINNLAKKYLSGGINQRSSFLSNLRKDNKCNDDKAYKRYKGITAFLEKLNDNGYDFIDTVDLYLDANETNKDLIGVTLVDTPGYDRKERINYITQLASAISNNIGVNRIYHCIEAANSDEKAIEKEKSENKFDIISIAGCGASEKLLFTKVDKTRQMEASDDSLYFTKKKKALIKDKRDEKFKVKREEFLHKIIDDINNIGEIDQFQKYVVSYKKCLNAGISPFLPCEEVEKIVKQVFESAFRKQHYNQKLNYSLPEKYQFDITKEGYDELLAEKQFMVIEFFCFTKILNKNVMNESYSRLFISDIVKKVFDEKRLGKLDINQLKVRNDRIKEELIHRVREAQEQPAKWNKEAGMLLDFAASYH